MGLGASSDAFGLFSIQIAHRSEDEAERRGLLLGCGLLGDVPSGKDQDGWTAFLNILRFL